MGREARLTNWDQGKDCQLRRNGKGEKERTYTLELRDKPSNEEKWETGEEERTYTLG